MEDKNTIRIDLAKHDALHGLMVNRGAPKHLLKMSFNLTDRELSAAKNEKSRAVMPSMQLMHLRKTLKNPTHGSYWMAIGSDIQDNVASACALAIMQSATLKNISEPHSGARPFYWNLYGGRWDRLRDDAQFRDNLGRIGLLVLTNLTADSTPEKIEKAVDLLQMYSNIPRVLLVSGADPLDFAVNRLYRKPSRVLHVRRRGVTHQV
jgi:hypothetical protein